MNTMTVSKEKVLEILKKNRDGHNKLFLQAQEAYRQQVIAELDEMLADARKNSKIRRHINLVAPMDYTQEYDKLIGLLEMSSDATLQMTTLEYQQFIMDDWNWAKAAKTTNSLYAGGMGVAENASLPKSY